MGSRMPSNLNITVFAAYHYGLVRAQAGVTQASRKNGVKTEGIKLAGLGSWRVNREG